MDIDSLSTGLVVDDSGIWRGGGAPTISYPADGNSRCYQLEDASFWFRHRNECIVSIIKQFPPNGSILDLGGGNGYVTRRLLDEGFDAALLEPGAEGAINGKMHRHIPEVICSTLEDAAFTSGSVAAVGCFDVIEHIEDDFRFIRSIHHILAPEGLLYATVPSHPGLWSRSDVCAGHYRRYNESSIRSLLEGHFEIERFTYFFSVLTPLIYIFRTLPFKLNLFQDGPVLSSKTEHGVKKSMRQHLVDWLLSREQKKLANGNGQSFGSSCLFVARKKIN